ncbi:MAG: hypothetical protein AAFV53_35870 [Myxococcota bacterium]
MTFPDSAQRTSLLFGLLCGLTLSAPAIAQDDADAAEAAAESDNDPRRFASCAVVLPPPPTPPADETTPRRDADPAPEPAPDPLCDPVTEAGRRCVGPMKKPGLARPNNRYKLFSEEDNPPPTVPPPPAYSTGMKHVFDWVKALSTCRYQVGAAIERPPEPIKQEFETLEQFAARKANHEQILANRAQQVSLIQQQIEPMIDQVTFAMVVPIETLGEFNAETSCFFPGVTARVPLDNFKARDTVYRHEDGQPEKYRIIPRDAPLKAAIGATRTIGSVSIESDKQGAVLNVTSHPVCVTPEMGRMFREQKERNGVNDFGIQAELRTAFAFTPGESLVTWKISGDFVYRGAEDLLPPLEEGEERPPVDRTLKVNPSAEKVISEPDPDPNIEPLPMDETGPLGCQSNPIQPTGATLSGLLWLVAMLGLGIRARQRR